MTLSQRDRRAIILGAIGLALVCFIRFGLMNFLDSWSDARHRIAAARDNVSRQERAISRVLGQRGRLASEYGQSVCKPLADSDTAKINLLAASQQALTKAGFEPDNYQPQPGKDLRQIPGLRYIPLQVRGKCSLDQLTKLLAGLPNDETPIIVDQLSIAKNEKKPQKLEVTMVLATLADQGEAAP